MHADECLLSAPILRFPDWNKEFHVHTAASLYAIACMLAQEGPLDHSIYFASRRLSAWELDKHRTFFIMIRPIPKTQDRAPELLITTYQKKECDKFIFSRFDYKPGSEDEKKKHKLPRSCSRLSRCHLRWMPPFHLKADRALSQPFRLNKVTKLVTSPLFPTRPS